MVWNHFGSPVSSERLRFVDTVLFVTVSHTITETLKWLSSLPVLMQESFWWWLCIGRYIISLFPNLHTPPPPRLPPPPPPPQSLIKPYRFCGHYLSISIINISIQFWLHYPLLSLSPPSRPPHAPTRDFPLFFIYFCMLGVTLWW